MEDLLLQEYPEGPYEIIVVDDHSSDNTSQIVSSFKSSENLKLFSNNGEGKKKAIKTGVENSHGELIITTDADCRMGKKWIGSIVSYFKNTGADLIIGPVTIRGNKSIFSRFQELEFFSLQGITAGSAAIGNPVMCNGANLAFTRTAYDKHSLNLYDEVSSGEDVFLLHSIKKENAAKIRFFESKEAVVSTGAVKSVFGFLRQRARWLSKAGYYTDRFTIFLGIITFAVIIDLLAMFITGFFYPVCFYLLGALLLIKAIPDALLLFEITRRRGSLQLMKWFIPAELVYPFYIITVVISTLFRTNEW
jgi:cellulose synthase/poly-beta-1,6-N-acetylglucosamine synthase-like glycosyltransferase